MKFPDRYGTRSGGIHDLLEPALQISSPWTNGKIEAFWGVLQQEVLDRQRFRSFDEAEAALPGTLLVVVAPNPAAWIGSGRLVRLWHASNPEPAVPYLCGNLTQLVGPGGLHHKDTSRGRQRRALDKLRRARRVNPSHPFDAKPQILAIERVVLWERNDRKTHIGKRGKG